MTKKDYEMIANEIKTQVINADFANIATLEYLANSMATRLEEDNPRFDRARFLTACGLE